MWFYHKNPFGSTFIKSRVKFLKSPNKEILKNSGCRSSFGDLYPVFWYLLASFRNLYMQSICLKVKFLQSKNFKLPIGKGSVKQSLCWTKIKSVKIRTFYFWPPWGFREAVLERCMWKSKIFAHEIPIQLGCIHRYRAVPKNEEKLRRDIVAYATKTPAYFT